MKSPRRRLVLAAIAATVATTLGVVAVNPAQAAPDQTGVTTESSMQAEVRAFIEAAIRLEPSIVRSEDGTLSLGATAAQAGVEQQVFNQVTAELEILNDGVRSGELLTTADLRVSPSSVGVQHNGVIYHWWGMEVHLNAVWTNRIVGAMGGGAGLSALAALVRPIVGAAVAFPIAGALLAIGAGVIQACSNAGGVRIFRTHTGQAWCKGH
jgi:hypothetical protein